MTNQGLSGINMIMSPEFMAPITGTEITESHTNLDGTVSRATVMIMDAHHHLFSLTVATAHDYERQVQEDMWENHGEVEDESEPVFVVPDDELTTDSVELVLEMPSQLLAKFLVEQEAAS